VKTEFPSCANLNHLLICLKSFIKGPAQGELHIFLDVRIHFLAQLRGDAVQEFFVLIKMISIGRMQSTVLAHSDNGRCSAAAFHHVHYVPLSWGLFLDKIDKPVHIFGHLVKTTFHGSHGFGGLHVDKKVQLALLISECCGERGQLSFVPRRKDGSH
jgi:hypothetical protein